MVRFWRKKIISFRITISPRSFFIGKIHFQRLGHLGFKWEHDQSEFTHYSLENWHLYNSRGLYLALDCLINLFCFFTSFHASLCPIEISNFIHIILFTREGLRILLLFSSETHASSRWTILILIHMWSFVKGHYYDKYWKLYRLMPTQKHLKHSIPHNKVKAMRSFTL